MPGWITSVLTSDFVWGLILGLLLSVFGAVVQARSQTRRLVEQQRSDITTFCRDVILNILRISGDLSEAKRRSNLIHNDLLNLIDVEIGVYGRNREHTIRLDDDLREAVRDYVTVCALRRADIAMALAAFDRQMELFRDREAKGDTAGAERANLEARASLQAAHRSTDELVASAERGGSLLQRMNDPRVRYLRRVL